MQVQWKNTQKFVPCWRVYLRPPRPRYTCLESRGNIKIHQRQIAKFIEKLDVVDLTHSQTLLALTSA